MIQKIQRIFIVQRDLLAGVRNTALEVRDIIETISLCMEPLTAVVCQECISVCCINKHSSYDRSDLIFMTALGRDIPEDNTGIDDSAPCRFLGRNGCILERSTRPYRCTWFFCTPLLDYAMEKSGPSGYRKLIGMLQRITEKRTSMIYDFETVLLKNPHP